MYCVVVYHTQYDQYHHHIRYKHLITTIVYMTTDLLILGIGVSEEKTDGVVRFEHFCKLLNLPYKILGENTKWNGGEMSAGPGGGQKINEVIKALALMDNQLVIICDTFDLFPIASKDEILTKYNNLCTDKTQILFSSEVFCWPSKNLATSYPESDTKYKYLNSGCIMGYRDTIYDLINGGVKDNEDDQLFFTLKYLTGSNIILDHKCELFQTISGTQDDLIVHKNRVYNSYTNTYPIFLHGNGAAKIFLNRLENYIDPYLFNGLNSTCRLDDLTNTQALDVLINTLPKVFIAMYIDSSKSDSLQEFLDSVKSIKYSSQIMHAYDISYNESAKDLLESMGISYSPHSNVNAYVYDDFKKSDCLYYFLIEQHCIIINKNILTELVPLCNGYRRAIAPLLKRKDNDNFTNYWGDLDNSGYYERSADYFTLISYKIRGLWNCPFVSGCILIRSDIINNWDISKPNAFVDRDMNLCCNFRRESLFMYMCNNNEYGYMV